MIACLRTQRRCRLKSEEMSRHGARRFRSFSIQDGKIVLTLLFVYYQYLLLGVGFSLVGSTDAEKKIKISAMITSEDLTSCKSALELADKNGDGGVDRQEFLEFVAVQSKGRIIADSFADLPLTLVFEFNTAACMCRFRSGASTNCCYANHAVLETKDDDSIFFGTFMASFCSDFDDRLAAILGQEEAPTVVPVETSIPSGAPVVANLPTSAPAVSFSPTRAPNLSGLPVSATTLAPTGFGQLAVTFQYNLNNGEGLDANAVLDGINNTLLDGIKSATRAVVLRTVLQNTTCSTEFSSAPSVVPNDGNRSYVALGKVDVLSIIDKMKKEREIDDNESSRGQTIARRLLTSKHYSAAHNTDTGKILLHHLSIDNHYHWKDEDQQRRQLACFNDSIPVQILEILDIPPLLCEEGKNCLLITTVITVFLQPGDARNMTRIRIMNGFKKSLLDGSFVSEIPSYT